MKSSNIFENIGLEPIEKKKRMSEHEKLIHDRKLFERYLALLCCNQITLCSNSKGTLYPFMKMNSGNNIFLHSPCDLFYLAKNVYSILMKMLQNSASELNMSEDTYYITKIDSSESTQYIAKFFFTHKNKNYTCNLFLFVSSVHFENTKLHIRGDLYITHN